MPRRCALGCPPNGGQIHLHSFPNPKKFPEQFESWARLLGGDLKNANELYQSKRVCDRHFVDKDWNRNNRLNALAVPSLYLNGIRKTTMTATKEPSATAQIPSVTAQEPSATTQEPSVTAHEPSVTIQELSVTTQVPTITTKEPSTATIMKPPASAVTRRLDYVDKGVRILQRLPIELNLHKDHSLQNATLIKNLSTASKKTHSKPPVISETIDYVKEGISTDEEPMFEVELNDDFIIQNIVETSTTVEKPFETVIDDQDVIMSEISAECVEGTSDTIPRVTRDTCGPDDACTSYDTTIPADTQAAPKDTRNNIYWKSKLTHILHSTQFCGICLCTDDSVNSVNDQFDIVVCDNTHTTTLTDILHVVFREIETLLSNSQLCNKCTYKLIQSYMFIQQARETSKILNCHVQALYNKSCYIRNSVVKEHEQVESTVQNVLIALDNFDTTNSFHTTHSIQQMKKEEKTSVRPKQRRKYKCLRCNLYLPSYKAWMVHEITTHKNKISFKTHMNVSRPNQEACKICQRVIQNGGLTEHMKKYHARSTFICSICNITFDSFKTFVTHKQEWHYTVDNKCLTCLENYSEGELEQHQCRFGCGSCAEVPCVHHKYLMCYREQILNGALRPKCLDCLYVCRTKEALLKHINMCHLKHRRKAAPR